jgi:hypothetical protein
MYSLCGQSSNWADFAEHFVFPVSLVVLSVLHTHLSSAAGTANLSTKGLILTSLLRLVQQAAVPRDRVSLHHKNKNKCQFTVCFMSCVCVCVK